MNKQEVLSNLCILITDIGSNLFDDKFEHECICGNIPHDNPVVDEKIVKFILESTNKEIRRKESEDPPVRYLTESQWERIKTELKPPEGLLKQIDEQQM